MNRSLSAPDAPAELNAFVEGWLWTLTHEGLVVDLGCGRGFWLERMVRAGVRAVGVEPEVDRARQAARGAAPVAVADGAGLPLRSGCASLVWCIHVLHHLDDPARVVAELRRVLRPGGYAVLAETVEDNPAVRVGRRFHPEWDGVPIRARFTAGRLLALVEDAGMEVVESRQHSLVSFAAWAVPGGGKRGWLWLSRVEGRLPRWTARWGAHLECVVRRPSGT